MAEPLKSPRFALRCIDDVYKKLLIDILDSATINLARTLETALHDLERFEAARDRGVKSFEGMDVETTIVAYQHTLSTEPANLHRIQIMREKIQRAPACNRPFEETFDDEFSDLIEDTGIIDTSRRR